MAWPKGYAVFQGPKKGRFHPVVLWASWATLSLWGQQSWPGSTQVVVSLRGCCFLFYFH